MSNVIQLKTKPRAHIDVGEVARSLDDMILDCAWFLGRLTEAKAKLPKDNVAMLGEEDLNGLTATDVEKKIRKLANRIRASLHGDHRCYLDDLQEIESWWMPETNTE